MGWGAIGAAAITYLGQQSANDANAAAMDKQNALTKEAAQNKYQWTVADLQKAGLNPMLAYTNGPNSVGQFGSAHYENSAGQGVSSALSAFEKRATVAQADATVKNIDADTVNKQTQTAAIRADIAFKLAAAAKAEQETRTSASSAAMMDSNVEVNNAQISRINQEIDNLKKTGRLTDAQVSVAKANLPLITSQIYSNYQGGNLDKTRAIESLTSSDRNRIETEIRSLERNKASAYSDYWGSGMGRAAPYLDQGFSTAKDAVDVFQGLRGGKSTVTHIKGK